MKFQRRVLSRHRKLRLNLRFLGKLDEFPVGSRFDLLGVLFVPEVGSEEVDEPHASVLDINFQTGVRLEKSTCV